MTGNHLPSKETLMVLRSIVLYEFMRVRTVSSTGGHGDLD